MMAGVAVTIIGVVVDRRFEVFGLDFGFSGWEEQTQNCGHV